MKTLGKLAAVLCLCTAPASGAIIVTSAIEGGGDGVQAQAVLENSSTFGQEAQGVAIKEFRGTIIVRDNVVPPDRGGGAALLVTKKLLTAQQAWGQNLPLGYANPPTTDPQGPWQGLMWPFRDPYALGPVSQGRLGDPDLPRRPQEPAPADTGTQCDF